MKVSRYKILDLYTLEELTREYTRADVNGRISLLKRLYRESQSGGIPFDIASLAANDAHAEVREWLALHGEWLDYSERRYEPDNDVILFPERNLEQKLKNDHDPFVRARLRENSTSFHSYDCLRDFQTSTHLERLALMRNPEVCDWNDGRNLLKKIFDLANHELAISLQERKELIAAFLTNQEAVVQLRENKFGPSTSTLWELASKWPKSPETEVRRTTRPVLMPHYVYCYLPVDDGTKAKIYRTEEDALCRLWILVSCTPDDVQTIQLGKKDKDKQCRERARQAGKKPQPSDQELDQKWKQEVEEKAQLRREVTSVLTRLGIALIVVKLYFPDWSDLALAISLGFIALLAALLILGGIFREQKTKREFEMFLKDLDIEQSIEKARPSSKKESPFPRFQKRRDFH